MTEMDNLQLIWASFVGHIYPMMVCVQGLSQEKRKFS